MAKKTDKKNQLILDNTKLEITIDKETWLPVYKKVLNRSAKKIKIDGFRKGKVPPHIAKNAVRPEYLYQETLEQLLPQAYEALIKKEKVEPITYPEFNPLSVAEDGDWRIEVQIAEAPTVSITGYTSIVKKAKKDAEKKWQQAQKDQKNKKEMSDEEKQAAKDDLFLKIIYAALVQELHPPVQELLVKRETEYALRELQQTIERFGMTIDQYLGGRKLNKEQLAQEIAAESLAKIQISYILAEITEKETLSATDADVTDYIAQLDNKDAQAHYAKKEQKETVRRMTTQKKLVEYLLQLS